MSTKPPTFGETLINMISSNLNNPEIMDKIMEPILINIKPYYMMHILIQIIIIVLLIYIIYKNKGK